MSSERSNLRQRLEPAVTPVFRLWWKMRRAMTLGVRGIATDADGRVLLVRHTYRHGWYLPGGGVESGETAAYSIAREMEEEAGVSPVGAPRLIGFYANHASFKNDHVALYRIDEWAACAPLENGEIAERGFFALSEIPAGTTQGTRRRLAEVFENAPIAADW